MAQPEIVCIGNITSDELLYVSEFPEVDDVAYVPDMRHSFGGRGGIVAMALGSLGTHPEIITVLPDSPEADTFKGQLAQNNVRTAGIATDFGASRMHEVKVVLSARDNNCISFFIPGDVRFEATERQLAIAANADIAYFSTHKRSFNEALLKGMSPSRTQIIHNLSSYLTSDAAYRDHMIQKSRALIGNQLEADALQQPPEQLFEMSDILQAIIITRGEQGGVVYEKGRASYAFEATPCAVETPVGAGDAFSAGIVYGMAQEWDAPRSAEFASRLAAISVSSRLTFPDIERTQLLAEEFGGHSE